MFNFSLPTCLRLVIEYDDVPSKGHSVLYQILSLEFQYNNGKNTVTHLPLKTIGLTY